MKRYAQIKYGKIIYFYETDLEIGELTSIFSPKTYWVDVTNKECALGWEVTHNAECGVVLTPPPPVIEPEQLTAEEEKELIKQSLLSIVDNYLDRTVQERGYDNIAKCVTYEGDIDPIFNREGTAAKQWRSKVYRTCYNILDSVECGYREIPTEAELLSELPKIDWGEE